METLKDRIKAGTIPVVKKKVTITKVYIKDV